MKTTMLLILLSSSWAFADDDLQRVLDKYRQSSLTEISLEKKTHSTLLDSTKTTKGTIFVKPGSLRWENEDSEKTLVLIEKGQLLIVTELTAQRSIMKTKIKDSNDLLSFLNTFKALDCKKESKTEFLCQKIKLKVDLEKMELTEISQKDEVDNLTTLKLNKTTFNCDKKPLFTYPINAKVDEVTEL